MAILIVHIVDEVDHRFGRQHKFLGSASCLLLVIWEQMLACLCAHIRAHRQLQAVAHLMGDAVGCATPPTRQEPTDHLAPHVADLLEAQHVNAVLK